MTIDNLSLAGKVAIVTGSGRENGIGAGIAEALARNGAAVTINHVSDSTADRAASVAKKITDAGGKAIVVKASVDEAGAKKLVDETLKAFGTKQIDILVNNAGTGHVGATLDLPWEKLAHTFEVNVYGPLHMVRATVPHMAQGGRIINITSIAQKRADPETNVYGATKAALDHLSHVWAGEFGKSHGITVNTIAPGLVPTDIVPTDPDFVKNVLDPMKGQARAAERFGTVEDIADATLLICSEKSRWITGQYIALSGGITY